MSNADQLKNPSPDYLTTFSLKCDPFANTLDGRFFYAGTALMQRLDLIAHLTQFGGSIILVSGPRGSGKTTLLSRFAAQANKQWQLCPINADEFDLFPQLLASALVTGGAQGELKMLKHWANETDSSQLLVILIDKSEMLPESAIEVLCRLLASSDGERVRLILFGTPKAQQALKTLLDSKQLPGSTQLLEVPRLSEEETSAYLMYRLAVAGYSGENPFTTTEIRAICKVAEGCPGNINLLAHESLREHQALKRSKRLKANTGKKKFSAAAWAPATLLIIGLAVYLGWQRLQPPPESESPTDNPIATAESIPLALPEPVQTPAPKAVPLQATTKPVSSFVPPVHTPAPPPESNPIASELTPPHPANTTVETNIKPAIPASIAPDTQPAEAETAAAVAPVEPIARSATTLPTVEVSPGEPHRETWLLEQSGQLLSLQLLGSRSQKSILTYVKEHKLDVSKSAYYQGQYRGGNWFVLMYGTYPDTQTAITARTGLPAAVRKDKPWPRRLASVHEAIKANRQLQQ